MEFLNEDELESVYYVGDIESQASYSKMLLSG